MISNLYSDRNKARNVDEVIIFDELSETGEGNNIFIRKKINNNWYFYYDDYDGKIDLNKLIIGGKI